MVDGWDLCPSASSARDMLPAVVCSIIVAPAVDRFGLDRSERYLVARAGFSSSSAMHCLRLIKVTEIRRAANGRAAQWLLRSDVDWWDLVRYGPPGFDVYVRIALPQYSEGDDSNPSGEAPADAVRAALATLGSYTTTPSQGYAAIWEGWTGGAPPAPQAPRVEIPNRAMLLFTGPLEALRDAPALAWYGSAADVGQGPHLVWPEDQAWCLACEVDEEIEFTVGCSEEAAQALARALPGAVRRAHYGEPAPLYRNPA